MRARRNFFRQISGGADGQGVDWLAYLVVVGGVTLWFLMSPLTSGATRLVLLDPDNYLRLVEVRDWLGGQSWWDTTQYRIDPPNGVQLHWSRLADVPLALLIVIFSLFVESQTAEVLAVICLPALLLLFTVVLLGRAARNVGGAFAETWARLLVISVPFVLVQYIPGRLDHHGLQTLMLAGALMAATAEPTRRSGLLVALPISISLLIGLEYVPLLLAIPSWMALNLLLGGQGRKAQFEGFALGIIVFLPALYVLSVAPSDWGRPTYDEVGRGHIAMIVSGGVALAVALRTTPASLGWRIIALSMAAVATALPLLAFPEVLSRPYSAIDPMLQQLWIDAIAETTSAAEIAEANPAKLIDYYLFPSLALLAGTALYLATGRQPKLLLVLLVGLAGFGLSLWQVRSMTGSSLAALLLSSLVGSYLWEHRSRRYGLAYLAAAITLLNGWTGSFLFQAIAPEGRDVIADSDLEEGTACEIHMHDAALDQVRPGLVLNGINSGGLILARTSHSVLAAGNHRAVDSNRKAYQIFLSPSSEARAKLIRSGVDYVLSCRDDELQRLANIAPDGFAADLKSGRIPNWLIPLHHERGKDVLFYAVARDATSAENPEASSGPSE